MNENDLSDQVNGIKPCPFHDFDPDHPCEICRYNDEFLARNNLTLFWWVACDECGAAGPQESTPEEAKKAWNTRPIEDELRKLLSEKEEKLEAWFHELCQWACDLGYKDAGEGDEGFCEILEMVGNDITRAAFRERELRGLLEWAGQMDDWQHRSKEALNK